MFSSTPKQGLLRVITDCMGTNNKQRRNALFTYFSQEDNTDDANTPISNIYGNCLHWAIGESDISCVTFLLKTCNADPFAIRKFDGVTAIDLAYKLPADNEIRQYILNYVKTEYHKNNKLAYEPEPGEYKSDFSNNQTIETLKKKLAEQEKLIKEHEKTIIELRKSPPKAREPLSSENGTKTVGAGRLF